MLQKRIPICNCPNCGRTVLFSNDPKEKLNVIVRVADDDYNGKTVLCAKCKTMLAVIEKPKVAFGFTAITIINQQGIR